jgi:hypothetical protein
VEQRSIIVPVAEQALQRVWISVHILVVGGGLFCFVDGLVEERRNRWGFYGRGIKKNLNVLEIGR